MPTEDEPQDIDSTAVVTQHKHAADARLWLLRPDSVEDRLPERTSPLGDAGMVAAFASVDKRGGDMQET